MRMSKPEKKGLVPERRFPEFRDKGEWIVKPFEEGFKRLTTKNSENNQNALTISAQQGLVSQLEYFNKQVAAKDLSGYYLLHKGDFAYNKSYSQGYPMGAIKPLRLYDKGVVSTLYICFRAKKGFNDSFFEYYFETGLLNPEIGKIAQEGGRAHGLLNVSVTAFFKDVNLLVPEPEEQQKIADCLTSVDELITAQTQKLDALKTHKKGLMQQLFPAEGETVPKRRFPEFLDKGGWKENTFGGVATFFNGRAYKQEELLEAGEYRVLRVGNFFSNNEWYYSDLELEDNKYCDNGDLLYAWSASFGPRIWKGEKVIYHYHIWKVVENEGTDKKFLFMLLDYETDRMKSRSANGLGLMHITKGTIESWKCYLPKIEEQQKIANCLTSIDDLISNQAQKVEALKSHKKGLMQQLFPAMDEVGA
jgi:type I restriction enzyme S subunit